MNIASFEINEREAWGIVLQIPKEEKLYVFEPQKVENIVRESAGKLGPWRGIAPAFMPEGWPENIKDFLEMGKTGMDILRRLHTHLETALERDDVGLFMTAGYSLDSVKMLPPVPRPGLFWGLVSNSPYSWRSTQRQIFNFFPQAHQRSIGALVGNNGIFYGLSSYNVEMGVVIGKSGRDISIDKAYEHIAGYTVVIDSQVNDFFPLFDDRYKTLDIEAHYGWYVGATASWMGKNGDAHCVVGPWIATPEEVGCPYDLLMYTGTNGIQRDRSHSAGISIGAERAIAFYSSFATLRAGDIIHLGTAGTDGICMPEEMNWGRNNTIESEIERVGKVQAHLYDPMVNDWMTEQESRPNGDFPDADEAIQKNFAPAVRYYLTHGLESLENMEGWTAKKARNFFICFANYKGSAEIENEMPTRVPRVLNAPTTALTVEQNVTLAKRAASLDIGVELAFVVGKIACKVSKERAGEYILGYAPMISVTDASFKEAVVEPATPQERGLPQVYGRWGDGYNVVGRLSRPTAFDGEMQLTVNERQIVSSLSEYEATAQQALSFISQVVTLFPGDVVTLGRTAERIHVEPDEKRIHIQARIEGVGMVEAVFTRDKDK